MFNLIKNVKLILGLDMFKVSRIFRVLGFFLWFFKSS